MTQPRKTQVRLCRPLGGNRPGTIISVIPSVAERLIGRGAAVPIEPRAASRDAAAPPARKARAKQG